MWEIREPSYIRLGARPGSASADVTNHSTEPMSRLLLCLLSAAAARMSSSY